AIVDEQHRSLLSEPLGDLLLVLGEAALLQARTSRSRVAAPAPGSLILQASSTLPHYSRVHKFHGQSAYIFMDNFTH
ncbi:hypothetical protein ACWGKK_38985, partial [Streptomyces chartreusis]